MNGQTRQVFWRGVKDIEYYQGEVKKDQRNGKGFLKHENGNTFDGKWENDS